MSREAIPDYSGYLIDARRELLAAERAANINDWPAMSRSAKNASESVLLMELWAIQQALKVVRHVNRTSGAPAVDYEVDLGTGADDIPSELRAARNITSQLRAARARMDGELQAELSDIGAPARGNSRAAIVGAFALGVLSVLLFFAFAFVWTCH